MSALHRNNSRVVTKLLKIAKQRLKPRIDLKFFGTFALSANLNFNYIRNYETLYIFRKFLKEKTFQIVTYSIFNINAFTTCIFTEHV